MSYLSCVTMKNQSVEITGKAEDMKAGAVIISNQNNKFYFIDGIKSWPEKIRGKIITLTGILKIFDTKLSKDDESVIKQQALGEKKLILNPKWRIKY